MEPNAHLYTALTSVGAEQLRKPFLSRGHRGCVTVLGHAHAAVELDRLLPNEPTGVTDALLGCGTLTSAFSMIV